MLGGMEGVRVAGYDLHAIEIIWLCGCIGGGGQPYLSW